MKRKRPAAVFLAASLAALVVGAASGHAIYQGGDTYTASDTCVTTNAAIDHGAYGWGYAAVGVESSTTLFWSIPCGWFLDRPPGYLAVKWELYKWNGSAWQLCNYIGWEYNGSTTSHLSREKELAGYNICGYAYYGVFGGGYTYNGGWKGGWQWASYHYLPAWA
jgi:hypothetical protein